MPNRRTRRPSGRAVAHDRGRESSGLIGLVRERPLLAVGLGIGMGMTLGALFPWDKIDTEFLGEQAEKLTDNALELAGDGYEKVKSAAQNTYETAAETLGVKKNGNAESSVTRSSETYGTSGT